MHVSPEHLLTQARERFAVQDYYGAAHLLEELLAQGRRFADAHQLLGLTLALLGQRERALREFEHALEINPRYVEAHLHRAVVLSEMGRNDEAAEAFRAAGTADPPGNAGYPKPIAARLANQHAALGEGYAEAGDVNTAIDQYRQAIGLGPGFHDLRYRLARLLLEAGRALDAREELERIVAEHPDFPDAIALLGLAHYLGGDAAAARDIWNRCRSRWPQNARVDAYLAMTERLTA